MKTKLIALASALAATTALASAADADAGGGVRLGFGVPLGSFVATPAHGGGASRNTAKARKAPAVQTARKPQKPVQRVVKAEPPPAPRPEAAKESAAERAPETQTLVPATGSSALIQGAIPSEKSAGATSASDVEGPAETTVTAHTNRAPDESEDCKKFIPAVGMTVSVGCDGSQQ
jgi:hypothetical protein